MLSTRLERSLEKLRSIARDGIVEAPFHQLAAVLEVQTERAARRLVARLVAARCVEVDRSRGGRGCFTSIRLVGNPDRNPDRNPGVTLTETLTEGGRGEARNDALSSPRKERNSFPSLRKEEERARVETLTETLTESRSGFLEEATADRLVAVLELVADMIAERLSEHREATATSSPRTSSPPAPIVPTKPKARAELWHVGDSAGVTETHEKARVLLAAELRPGDDLAAKLRDVRCYPFDDVLRALHSVELAKARGVARSPAGLFWSALTDPEHRFQEGAVLNEDSVRETLAREAAKEAPVPVAAPPRAQDPAERFLDAARAEIRANGIKSDPPRSVLIARARTLEAQAPNGVKS